MTKRLHLSSEHRVVIEALLREHLPGIEVWAYGSRVNGRAHDGSDLDLVLRGPGLKEIPVGQLRDFVDAVGESRIPILVEARDWARLPEGIQREIERGYMVLVEEDKPDSSDGGWISLRLGDVCTKIGSGATPRGGSDVHLKVGPCSLIGSQNIYNNRFARDGLVYLTNQQATDQNNVEVLPDDVLLNITGDSVARACQVPTDVLPARVNQHVAIIRPNPNKLSARFLRYILVSPRTQTLLKSWAGSGGTRNALTKGMIESLGICVPADIGEQRAIAHILGTLDDKIELNRRMNETLESMSRALFKSWFVDFDPVHAKAALRTYGAQSAPVPITPPQGGSDESVERVLAYLGGMVPAGAARSHEIAQPMLDRVAGSMSAPGKGRQEAVAKHTTTEANANVQLIQRRFRNAKIQAEAAQTVPGQAEVLSAGWVA